MDSRVKKESRTIGQLGGGFPQTAVKVSVAEHDDYVDTFTQAVIYLKNDGWFELPKAKDPDGQKQFKREYANPYAA